MIELSTVFLYSKTLFVIALVFGIIGIIVVGVIGLALTSSSRSEAVNDEILTFDVDCQEGYEFDASGSTCVLIKEDETNSNETTLTEAVIQV